MKYNEQEALNQWINQIKSTTSSLTISDSEDLKNHLLDTIDELKARGLNDREAFEVATLRLGKNFNFEEEYARVNSDALLIRNILLVFSGIMTYFLLYYSMTIGDRLMYYNFHETIRDPKLMGRYTQCFLFCYHLIIMVSTIIIYKWNKTFLSKIKNLRIKPLYIFLLIALIFGLAYTDFQLHYLVKDEVTNKYLTDADYHFTLRIVGYSFPFWVCICFFILLIKSKSLGKNLIKWQKDGETDNNELKIEELIKSGYGQHLQELKNVGWNEEEAIAVIKKRYNILSPYDQKPVNISTGCGDKPVKFHLIVLSGGLVYLLLYYLLHSTSRIFFAILQYFKNDPMRNFGWTKWYMAFFNLLLIFFTISIYIKDRDLIQKLKKINLNKFYIIFFTTMILAIIDNNFLLISRGSLDNIFELKVKFNDILQFSDLYFSLVISLCFVILFNKYYKENMKIY